MNSNIPSVMRAWQVNSYEEQIQCVSLPIPSVKYPTDVLIRIEATSINPIDTLMKEGYGRTLMKAFKLYKEAVLPMVLGRDFSGEIVDKGEDVSNFEIGDKVMGVIPFHKLGTHAEYTVAHKDHIFKKPNFLTHVQAASVLYTSLTVYCALWNTGGLSKKNPKNMKILILGVSGGVGTCAVQMLKAVGATVIGTCSTDAVPLVKKLGTDFVYDYKDPDYIDNVASQNNYDIILDCAALTHSRIPSSWKYSTYIGLNSPILLNTDNYGLLIGLTLSASQFLCTNIIKLFQWRSVKWAFFSPSKEGLQFIEKIINDKQLTTVIQHTFPFDKMTEAYETFNAGHTRGKIVVDYLK